MGELVRERPREERRVLVWREANAGDVAQMSDRSVAHVGDLQPVVAAAGEEDAARAGAVDDPPKVIRA